MDAFGKWMAANAHFGAAKLARAARTTPGNMGVLLTRAGISVKKARAKRGVSLQATPKGKPPKAPKRTAAVETVAATPYHKLKRKERDEASRVEGLRRKVRDLESTNAALLAEQGQDKELFDAVLAALDSEPARDMIPVLPPSVHVKKPSATFVGVGGDWHTGEVVSKRQTSGWGEYSPAILERRILQWTEDIVSYLQTMRAGYEIDDIAILLLGDMVSGDIHVELSITNEWPAPEQAVWASKLAAQMVAEIARHAARVRVYSKTTGNHGRLSQKPQHKNAGTNNWDYIVSEMAKVRLANQTNVVWESLVDTKSLIKIHGVPFLVEHGDAYKAWNSIPQYGIERGLRSEAWRRMGKPKEAFRYDLMGHWHGVFMGMSGHVRGFGSPKGACEYSNDKGFLAEPSQSAFLVGSHGLFAQTDFDLT